MESGKRPGEQRSALSLIKDLLFSPHAKSPPSPEAEKQAESPLEEVRAEFIPPIRKIELIESPIDNWRRRKTLPASVSEDESIANAGRGSFGAEQEIVFRPEHRLLLRPPYQNHKFKRHRKLEYINTDIMRSFVQVLTTPTADTPGTTLLLHFDNKRYLIGSLAEGTQRAGVQMGARFLKVSECFITGRTEWLNTGGLIGMILTLADGVSSSQAASREEAVQRAREKGRRLGVVDDTQKMRELVDEAKRELKNNTLTLYGPPNLSHTLATARRFVFRKGMPIDVHEVRDDKSAKQEDEDECAPYYADENVKVWAMSISPKLASRPTTPRKRSIHEVYKQDGVTNGAVDGELSSEDRDQLTVKAVVSEMFNSSWRLDTLYETPLSEVKLPASIFIRNPETNKVEKYHGPLPGGEKPLPDPSLNVLVRKPWPGALVESLPKTEPAKESISYIIRNHRQRGKFKPDAAKKLKVEMGFKWSKLSNGESVLNADGETITSDMVLGPSKEGGGLAVVDLPDPSYIDPLINRPEWREQKIMAGVGAVVWICGKDVATDPRVHGFMRQFSNLEHLISSPDYCLNEIALSSAAASTVRLRKVDPGRYNVPVHDVSADGAMQLYGGNDEVTRRRSRHPLPEKGVHIAARGQVIQLEPSFELQQRQVFPPFSVSEVENEMSQEVLDEAAKAQEAVKADEQQESAWASSIPDKDAEIITLGTGSALPSKYRNISATLLRLPGWGCMLFDCGENTLGQLKRVFQPSELKQVLQDLKIIFISHMHADHHLGTVNVVKAWYEEVHGGQLTTHSLPANTNSQPPLFEDAQERKLAIISEPAMLHWLSEYASIEDYGYSHLFPLHISPAYPAKSISSKLSPFTPPFSTFHPGHQTLPTIPASHLNLADIQAVLVPHCHGARALSVTFPSGFKVSYSGDCRPSQAFVQIGKGSTVCIHEATFDDELYGDAVAKQHSTTSEALGVAAGMGARGCVLTHFSQRYQKLPVLEYGGNGGGSGVDGVGEVGKEGESITQPVEDNVVDGEEDAAMDAEAGPLEGGDAFAPTMPDQATNTVASTNGSSDGQHYDVANSQAKSTTADPASKSAATAAVPIKLSTEMKVCVAFDYMRLRVGDMAQMEKFTPALLKLFAEEDKEDENDVGGGADGAANGNGSKKNGNGNKKKDKRGINGAVEDKGYLKKGFKRFGPAKEGG